MCAAEKLLRLCHLCCVEMSTAVCWQCCTTTITDCWNLKKCFFGSFFSLFFMHCQTICVVWPAVCTHVRLISTYVFLVYFLEQLPGLLKLPVVSGAREGPESRTVALSRLKSDVCQSLKNTDATPTAHMAAAWHSKWQHGTASHTQPVAWHQQQQPRKTAQELFLPVSLSLSLSLSLKKIEEGSNNSFSKQRVTLVSSWSVLEFCHCKCLPAHTLIIKIIPTCPSHPIWSPS